LHFSAVISDHIITGMCEAALSRVDAIMAGMANFNEFLPFPCRQIVIS